MLSILVVLVALFYYCNVYFSPEIQSFPLNTTCTIRRTKRVKVKSLAPKRVVVNTRLNKTMTQYIRICDTVGIELYLHGSAPIPSSAAITCIFQDFLDGIALFLRI